MEKGYGNHPMNDTDVAPEDIDVAGGMQGDEVMDSLGVVQADSSDYIEEDDVSNSIARGDF